MEPIVISNIIGWIYTVFWFLSNVFNMTNIIQKKTGEGINLDFQIFNTIGFLFLSINYLYGIVTHIEGVHINDLAFSSSVFIIQVISIILTYYYPRKGNKITYLSMKIIFIMLLSILIYYLVTLKYTEYISVFELFGINKILLTILKYVTQIIFNYRRKSTYGWSSLNTIFDLLGSFFSLTQVIYDYSNDLIDKDYYKNPLNFVKVMLGIVTIFFDFILFIQRFIVYRKNHKSKSQLLIN